MRVVDLNKARAARLEKKDPGPVVEFGPHKLQCPPEVPFMVLEAFGRMQQAQKEDSGDIAASAMLDAVHALLGEKGFKLFMGESPATEDIGAFLEGVLGEYGLDAGESPASPSS
jgi:hypothetical protein